LANKRSIAWAIAKKLHEAGWRLAITIKTNARVEAKDLIAEMPGPRDSLRRHKGR